MNYRRWRPPPVMREGAEEGFFHPEIDCRLPIRKNEKVFAIGSCFARNVEAYLTPHFQVPSHIRPSDVPPEIAAIHGDLTANMKICHRYNVFSIRNSLEWALEPDAPTARHRLMAVGPGSCLDPYAGLLTILKTEAAERVRRWIDATIATVRECRIVIITLGLSEVWQDQETGLVMNCAPTAEMWQAYPQRFRFRVARYAETVQELNSIHAVLSRYCPHDFQVVVTVSPIPLRATFREMDIVVANTASKSILRAAVDEWPGEHDNIHYFPSYEMILNSSAKRTWLDDFRHCTTGSIKRVMDVFLREFVSVSE